MSGETSWSACPRGQRGQVRASMNKAYRASSNETGLDLLENLARFLDKRHMSAAASMPEGLEETLTVTRLGLTGALRRMEISSPIENLNGGVRHVGGRGKRFRRGRMAQPRRGLESSPHLPPSHGHRDRPEPVTVLRARDNEQDNATDAG
ncbi:MAG TPA: hypothetical protein VMK12_09905 [Anaeromyxobacteraceae bacterium]|nr:hypothetical protein [Anaeromyxobacteraceae bacterium]